MTNRLLILLVNTDPRNVEELGAPFYYAAVAAAMDYEIMVDVGPAVQMKPLCRWLRGQPETKIALVCKTPQPALGVGGLVLV